MNPWIYNAVGLAAIMLAKKLKGSATSADFYTLSQEQQFTRIEDLYWKTSTCFGDLQIKMLDFLNGDLFTTPWHGGPIDSDHESAIEDLKIINRLGFLTINGQTGETVKAGKWWRWDKGSKMTIVMEEEGVSRGYLEGYMTMPTFRAFMKTHKDLELYESFGVIGVFHSPRTDQYPYEIQDIPDGPFQSGFYQSPLISTRSEIEQSQRLSSLSRIIKHGKHELQNILSLMEAPVRRRKKRVRGVSNQYVWIYIISQTWGESDFEDDVVRCMRETFRRLK